MIASSHNSKLFFLGTPGLFSYAALASLCEQGIAVDRIYCAGAAPARPIDKALPVTRPVTPGTINELAQQRAIPIYYINGEVDFPSPEKCLEDRPDYILVACFPHHLPNYIRQWPRTGCLNIHPSLLPGYRGPDPIYWQLFNNEPQTGVSLHMVSEELDAGPVVMQQPVAFIDGSDYNQLNTLLANMGAKLFGQLLKATVPVEKLLTYQNEEEASYYPMPSQSGYCVTTQWSARHAFNFMRGTCPPNGKFSVETNNGNLIVTDVIDYTDNSQLENTFTQEMEDLYIQFAPGILHAHGYCQD